ncbi:MAG TPA: ABC transporter permease subunit [Acidimicrobiia bacterium]|nr:ABC transporter permease subunit [Acidimicrobiia bacterium]
MADLHVLPEEASPESKGPPETSTKPPRASRRRTIWIVVGLLAAFVIYAYGFQVTRVNLDAINDETRQESLFRVIRALSQPDLLTYEVAETATDLEYMTPCPSGGFEPAAVTGEATLTVDPPCADPRTVVTVSGTGYRPNDQVRIFFVPPNGVELRLENVRTDADGNFQTEARVPARPDTEVQTLRVKSVQSVGSIFSPVQVEQPDGTTVRSPRWSQNAIDTLDKIIETVFLALLATTLGTLIAVPLSFLAARNLMKEIRLPPLQLGLAVAGIPIGVGLGLLVSGLSGDLIRRLPDSALLLGIMMVGLGWLSFRLLILAAPTPGANTSRAARIVAGAGATLAFLLAAQSLVRFAQVTGAWLAPRLGAFDFLGNFLLVGGDILAAVFGLFTALAGAGLLAFLGSRLGYVIGRRASPPLKGTLSVLAAALAGALIALAIGQAIAWLYQITSVRNTIVIPAVIGALIGALVGWRGLRTDQVPVGMWVYYVFRTLFNTLRSIEALILAIVFVIWVGLGAFAGALALALHTVAASAKLYSEQVESINAGPVEAVKATGATRLQTVVYAVVPQIVPPYISFTMYRWDINVRMSTIIGFVGGGGIGFLLQQNIALLDYRAAAAQMLAIAIVVASMDYVSSRLRERYV